MAGIKFNYLYRDAGNYKAWGEVIFANPENITVREVFDRLTKAFDSDSLFIADQLRLPEVFLFLDGHFSTDDHCFHEFSSVELSHDLPTDELNRSIRMFVKEVEFESQRGWRAFNPFDRNLQLMASMQKNK